MPDLLWTLLKLGGYLALALVALVIAVTLAMLALFTAAVLGVLLDGHRARKQADREYREMCEHALDYAVRLYARQEDVK